MPNYVFDWDSIFTAGNSPSTTMYGPVEIRFTSGAASGGSPASSQAQISSATLGGASDGHLALQIDATAPGQGLVQTIRFDNQSFPATGITDLSFTLYDVDRATWDDQVQIVAYDRFGDVKPVSDITLTPSGFVAVGGNVATGGADVADASADGNVDVAIDGDISRIDIIFTAGPGVAGDPDPQIIGVGPLSYTAAGIYDDRSDESPVPTDAADDGMITGTDEDDLIFGGTIADGGLTSGTDSGADNDTTTPDDTIDALAGNDRVYGGAGNDTINAGAGEDFVFGGAGADTLNGDGEVDFIFGEEGNDILSGGAGGDFLTGGDGADEIYGNEGSDTITASAAEVVLDTVIDGGDDGDVLEINPLDLASADIRGVDIRSIEFLEIDRGTVDFEIQIADTLADDLRAIFLEFSGSTSSAVEISMDTLTTLNLNPISVNNFKTGDSITIIGDGDGEQITGTFVADSIFGNGGNDILVGGGGEDVIDGGAGNDIIEGGFSADILSGGDDDDLFRYSQRSHAFGDQVDGGAGGATDWDTLDLTGFGPIQLINLTDDADGNSQSGTAVFVGSAGPETLDFNEIEHIAICFTPGTQLVTPAGGVDVAALRPGDRVLTRDNGIQDIAWIGRKCLTAADLTRNIALQPIRIAKGALGDGRPYRDMLVSPSHRMLLTGGEAEMLFGEPELLVPAKHLTDRPGITRVLTPGIAYIHIMFEQHQVVLGDGAWSESFQPGTRALAGLDAAQREELICLFPDLRSAGAAAAYPAARPTLKSYESTLMQARPEMRDLRTDGL